MLTCLCFLWRHRKPQRIPLWSTIISCHWSLYLLSNLSVMGVKWLIWTISVRLLLCITPHASCFVLVLDIDLMSYWQFSMKGLIKSLQSKSIFESNILCVSVRNEDFTAITQLCAVGLDPLYLCHKSMISLCFICWLQ